MAANEREFTLIGRFDDQITKKLRAISGELNKLLKPLAKEDATKSFVKGFEAANKELKNLQKQLEQIGKFQMKFDKSGITAAVKEVGTLRDEIKTTSKAGFDFERSGIKAAIEDVKALEKQIESTSKAGFDFDRSGIKAAQEDVRSLGEQIQQTSKDGFHFDRSGLKAAQEDATTLGEILKANALIQAGEGFANALISGANSAVNILQRGAGFFAQQFRSSVQDQAEDIQARGSLFGSLSKEKLLTGKTKEEVESDYKQTKVISRANEQAIGQLIRTSSVSTSVVTTLSRQMTDNLLPTLLKAKGITNLSGMSREELDKTFGGEKGVGTQLARVYEQMATVTPSPAYASTTAMGFTQAITSGTINRQLNVFENNPVLVDALKTIDGGIQGTADIGKRIEILRKALEVAAPTMMLDEMKQSISGGMQAVQDTIMNPTVGILSLGADVANEGERTLQQFKESKAFELKINRERDNLQRIADKQKLTGLAKEKFVADNLKIITEKLEEAVRNADSPIEKISISVGPLLQSFAGFLNTFGNLFLGPVTSAMSALYKPFAQLEVTLDRLSTDVESGNRSIGEALGRAIAEFFKAISNYFNPEKAGKEIGGGIDNFFRDFAKGFRNSKIDGAFYLKMVMDSLKSIIMKLLFNEGQIMKGLTPLGEGLGKVFLILSAPAFISALISGLVPLALMGMGNMVGKVLKVLTDRVISKASTTLPALREKVSKIFPKKAALGTTMYGEPIGPAPAPKVFEQGDLFAAPKPPIYEQTAIPGLEGGAPIAQTTKEVSRLGKVTEMVVAKFGQVRTNLGSVGSQFTGFFKGIAGKLSIFGAVITAIISLFQGKGLAQSLAEGAGPLIGAAIGQTIGFVVAPLLGPLAPLGPLLGGVIGGWIGSMKEVTVPLSQAFQAIGSTLMPIMGSLGEAFMSIMRILWSLVSSVFPGFNSGMSQAESIIIAVKVALTPIVAAFQLLEQVLNVTVAGFHGLELVLLYFRKGLSEVNKFFGLGNAESRAALDKEIAQKEQQTKQDGVKIQQAYNRHVKEWYTTETAAASKPSKDAGKVSKSLKSPSNYTVGGITYDWKTGAPVSSVQAPKSQAPGKTPAPAAAQTSAPIDFSKMLSSSWNSFLAWTQNVSKGASQGWNNIVTSGSKSWNSFTTWVSKTSGEISSSVMSLLEQGGKSWNSLVNWVYNAPGNLAETVGYAIGTMEVHWKSFWTWWDSLPGQISSTWDSSLDTIEQSWSNLSNWWYSLPGQIGGIWDTSVSKAEGHWNNLVTWWNSIPGQIAQVWNNIVSRAITVWKSFLDWWNSLPGQIAQVWNNIVSKASSVWASFLAWWNSLPGQIAQVWNSIVSRVSSAWASFLAWWNSLPGQIAQVWSSITAAIGRGVESFKARVSEAGSGIGRAIMGIADKLRAARDRVANFVSNLNWGSIGDVLLSGVRSIVARFQEGREAAKPTAPVARPQPSPGRGREPRTGAGAFGDKRPFMGSLSEAINFEMAHKPPGSHLVIANSSETIIPAAAKAFGENRPFMGNLSEAINFEMAHKPPGSHLVIANSSETVIPAAGGFGDGLKGLVDAIWGAAQLTTSSLSRELERTSNNTAITTARGLEKMTYQTVGTSSRGFSSLDASFRSGSERTSKSIAMSIANSARETQQILQAIKAIPASRGLMGGMEMGKGYGGGGVKIAGMLGNYIKATGGAPGSIWEHPWHGGVKGRHSRNSYHYSGRAIDIGAYANEQAGVISRIHQFNAKYGVRPVEFLHAGNDRGHQDHVHVAYAMGPGRPALFPSLREAQEWERKMIPSSLKVQSITTNSGEMPAPQPSPIIVNQHIDPGFEQMGRMVQTGQEKVASTVERYLSVTSKQGEQTLQAIRALAAAGGLMGGGGGAFGGLGSVGAGGKYGIGQLGALAQSAGFRGQSASIMAGIAMAESGGNPRAHNPVPPDNSYGLWQINMLGGMGPERRRAFGLRSNEDLFNPMVNAKVAYSLSNGGSNFRPWSTYTNGAYKKYMHAAYALGPGKPAFFSTQQEAENWERKMVPSSLPIKTITTNASEIAGTPQSIKVDTSQSIVPGFELLKRAFEIGQEKFALYGARQESALKGIQTILMSNQRQTNIQLSKLESKFSTPSIGGLGGAQAGGVDSFTPMAQKHGLIVTSSYRAGDKGWHGVNRARDYSNSTGPTPQMMAFAKFMASRFGRSLKELIYTPLGFSIKNGQVTRPLAAGSHYNHVHVAYAYGPGKPALFPTLREAQEWESKMIPSSLKVQSVTTNSGELPSPQPTQIVVNQQVSPGFDQMGRLVQSGQERVANTVEKYLLVTARQGEQTLQAIRALAAAGGLAGKGEDLASPGAGGKYGIGQLASLAQSVGFQGQSAAIMAGIAMAESSGNPRAHNPVPPDNSYGLWQINMLGGMGPERRKAFGLGSNEELFNPMVNAKVAYSLSSGGSNFKPWSTYTNGSYKKYMHAAYAFGPGQPAFFPTVQQAEDWENRMIPDNIKVKTITTNSAEMPEIPNVNVSLNADPSKAIEKVSTIVTMGQDKTSQSVERFISTSSMQNQQILQAIKAASAAGGFLGKDKTGGLDAMSLEGGPGTGGVKIAGMLGNYIKSTGGAPGSIHEHPWHGGIKYKHSAGSYHYQGRAIDLGAYANEQAGVISRISAFNAKMGVSPVEFLHAGNRKDHQDHVHVAYALGAGNPAFFGNKADARKWEKKMVPHSPIVETITSNAAEMAGTSGPVATMLGKLSQRFEPLTGTLQGNISTPLKVDMLPTDKYKVSSTLPPSETWGSNMSPASLKVKSITTNSSETVSSPMTINAPVTIYQQPGQDPEELASMVAIRIGMAVEELRNHA